MNSSSKGEESGSSSPEWRDDLEFVELDEGDASFIRQVLDVRSEVQDLSKGKLKVTPEVAARIEITRENISKEVFRLAIVRSRAHNKDAYLLKEDVDWAHKRLLSGGGTSMFSIVATSIGGLLAGAGIPKLVDASTGAGSAEIQPADVASGSIFTFLGVMVLAFGYIAEARRSL